MDYMEWESMSVPAGDMAGLAELPGFAGPWAVWIATGPGSVSGVKLLARQDDDPYI